MGKVIGKGIRRKGTHLRVTNLVLRLYLVLRELGCCCCVGFGESNRDRERERNNRERDKEEGFGSQMSIGVPLFGASSSQACIYSTYMYNT